MNWNKIDRDLAKVLEIIRECCEGAPLPELEKDFVLGKLRNVYEEIKFAGMTETSLYGEDTAGQSFDMAGQGEGSGNGKQTKALPEADVWAEQGAVMESKGPEFHAIVTEMPKPVDTCVPEPAMEKHAGHAVVGPEAEPAGDITREPEPWAQPDFGREPESAHEPVEHSKPKTTREALRSLYDDCGDDTQVPMTPAEERGGEIKPEPVPVKSYHNEQVKVLGETLGDGGRTIADAYASQHKVPDVASALSSAHVDSLRSSIGLNDKFLLVRDLFDSEAAAYESAMDRFEEFDDLDDAMVYIYENFNWNPDEEAVRLLVDLLTRKLS